MASNADWIGSARGAGGELRRGNVPRPAEDGRGERIEAAGCEGGGGAVGGASERTGGTLRDARDVGAEIR